jgi:hypothetical protein
MKIRERIESLLAANSLSEAGRQRVKVPTLVRFMTPKLGGQLHSMLVAGGQKQVAIESCGDLRLAVLSQQFGQSICVPGYPGGHRRHGIPIPIRPEFLFTSQRNVHSHRPEYPKTLQAVSVLAESLTIDTAIVAGHADLDLSSGRVQNERGRQKSLASGVHLRLSLAGSSNCQRGELLLAP